jgi:hypothetical protein
VPIRRAPDGTVAVMAAKALRPMAMRLVLEDLPKPQPEYQFVPERGWRFDYAWPDYMVALEIEGGVYSDGRHVRGAGYEGDLMKYNQAVLRGWKVIRFSLSQILKKPTLCHQILQAAFPPKGAVHAQAK